MYLVAITRWGPPLDREIGFLSRITGVAPPDLRMYLAGELPVFLAGGLDAASAQEMIAALAERGHGCVASDATQIPSASDLFSPRRFELRDDAFVGFGADGASLAMPHREILALIRATVLVDVATTVEEKKRKFSMGRAVITGGLVTRKTTSKKRSATATEREPALYVFRTTGRDHLLLRENDLRYEGLEDRIGRTRHENFNILTGTLRERAPRAFFDQRFVSGRPPRLPPSAVAGELSASELDLAAYMLVAAFIKGQL